MKQLTDILTKYRELIISNKRVALAIGALLCALISAGVVFYFTDIDQQPQKVKPVDNITVKKPDKLPIDNKTKDNQTKDNETIDNTSKVTHVSSQNILYTALYKKDPFIPLVVKKTETLVKKKSAFLLEDYDILDFKLIAIVSDLKKRYAMIVLPDGKSYTLTEGLKIGASGRMVHKINKDYIIFKEPIRDQSGKIKLQDVSLKLRKEEQ